MRVLERGIGRGTLASTGSLQQPQSQCRGTVPGDVPQQGKGWWGRPGQLSCLKQNFTVFRHCCHQEQARGKVTHNIGQWRQQRIQLFPTSSSFICRWAHLRIQASHLQVSLCQQILWSPEARSVFARYRACLSLEIKVWGMWSASTCTRCIQGCSYSPVLEGSHCGFSSHTDEHWISAQVDTLRWVPEWNRDPQEHPNIPTVQQKRWRSAKMDLITKFIPQNPCE